MFLMPSASAGNTPATDQPEADQAWSPLRVHVQCQGWGRTKACPAFLRGFIDRSDALEWGTRATAQVVVYYNVNQIGNDDLIHLRLTSTLADVPAELEISQTLDTRTTDDEQMAQLEPAFNRGIAVYLGTVLPEAVHIELVAPPAPDRITEPSSPWGLRVWVGGWANWTEQFQSRQTWAGLNVERVTTTSRLAWTVSGENGQTRQPPLIIEGEAISLDSASYDVASKVLVERHLSDAVSTGALVRSGHQDPEGQYLATGRAHVGIGYDWFDSDDPRGNSLGATYVVGGQVDRYNVTNVLNEDIAIFATHGLLITGSVRKDKLTYGVHGQAMAMVLNPLTRNVLNFGPRVSLQVGDHVDLTVSTGVTKQAIPGPRDLDLGDFEVITRASYAEPLQLDGFFAVDFHWDRANGARNNRWNAADQLGSLSNL